LRREEGMAGETRWMFWLTWDLALRFVPSLAVSALFFACQCNKMKGFLVKLQYHTTTSNQLAYVRAPESDLALPFCCFLRA